jgi:type IV secretory pathway TraG/TraD family ATPase VirD4
MSLSSENKAVFLINGKKPILLTMKAYFNNRKFKKMVKKAFEPSLSSARDIELEYLSLCY